MVLRTCSLPSRFKFLLDPLLSAIVCFVSQVSEVMESTLHLSKQAN